MAARCMKARKSSRLSCGCYVRVGELITKQPGGGWRCIQCALGPDHAAAVNAIDAILGATDADEWIRTHPPAIRTDHVTRDEALRRLAGTGAVTQLISEPLIRVVGLLDSASVVQWWQTAR